MKKLSPTVEKYVLHWGEMGSRWGVNRTIAQIHALLYLSPEPLPAEDIVALLGVARSNVSTSLRELQSIGLVKVSHVMGDRRDRFEVAQERFGLGVCRKSELHRRVLTDEFPARIWREVPVEMPSVSLRHSPKASDPCRARRGTMSGSITRCHSSRVTVGGSRVHYHAH